MGARRPPARHVATLSDPTALALSWLQTGQSWQERAKPRCWLRWLRLRRLMHTRAMRPALGPCMIVYFAGFLVTRSACCATPSFSCSQLPVSSTLLTCAPGCSSFWGLGCPPR